MGKIRWKSPRGRLKAVFGGEMATAKIQTVKGLRVEIFFAPCAKKYYSSLDSLDRRNGYRTEIVFSREMCYTWVSKLIDKSRLVRTGVHDEYDNMA